jgi:hypothetical protein
MRPKNGFEFGILLSAFSEFHHNFVDGNDSNPLQAEPNTQTMTPKFCLKSAILATLLLSGGVSFAAQTMIGIDFQGRKSDSSGSTDPLDPSATAGVVPQAFWNSIDDSAVGEKGTSDPLNDSDGNPTAVTVTFNANDSWNNDTDPATITTGNAQMMNGIIKANGGLGAAESFTFDNLTDGIYDIYVYMNENGDGTTLNINDGDNITTFYVGETHTFTDTSTFQQATNTNPNGTRDVGNYVKFAGLNTLGRTSLSITATHIAGTDGIGIAGFQLIKTGNASPNTNPVGIALQPVSQTAAVGNYVAFSIISTGPQAKYQWYKNGTAIAGATNSFYTTAALAAGDSGASYHVVVSNNVNSVTSSDAVLTVKPATLVAGYLKQEFFANQTRASIENGTAGAPTYVKALSSFEAPVNDSLSNFGQRISGYFIPAVTGDYVFFLSSDDHASLYLSTDANPANKRLIAQETVWSNSREWTISGGGSDLAQKRSDQFSPDGGNTVPFSSGIHLVAGTKYYIEGVNEQGGGGDNLGVTFKLAADADPASPDSGSGTSGDASKLTGNVVAFNTTPITNLNITQQPANTTVAEGFAGNLSVAVQTDSEQTPLYQWKRNGTDIAGATTPTYSFVGNTADNGAKYSVVVTVPGYGSVTSSNAVLTVQTPVLITGFLKYENWPNKVLTDIIDGGTPGDPTTVSALSSFETPLNAGDPPSNYADRVSGYFIPPATGNYVFFLGSDDDSNLYLSTDDKPENKKLIAHEAGWSPTGAWVTVGGGSASILEDKRSDSFSSIEWPDGNTITLTAGKKYYIEADHHEGGGGDWLGVYVKRDTDEDPTDNIPSNLSGTSIGFFGPSANLTITQQPSATSVTENRRASFSAAAVSDSALSSLVTYQWLSNGVAIAGASSASYTTPKLSLANNNDKYSVVFGAPGATSLTSAPVAVTVVADTFAPIAQAGAIQHGAGVDVGVSFDEAVSQASATKLSNYTISGGTITSANMVMNQGGTVNSAGDITDVILSTTGLTPGNTYTLSVSGVADLKGNAMAAKQLTFTVPDTQWASVGSPTIPAAVVPVGTNGYDVVSGGKQYWGDYDEITFVYKKRTNDFDMKVQVVDQDFSSQWGRGGFAVREDTDEGKTQDGDVANGYLFSAYREIHANPNQTHSDVNLTANNNFEANQRVGTKYDAADNTTSGWMTGNGAAPTYPNVWLRLQRQGDNITGYRSTNGVDWLQIAASTWSNAPAVLLVGPAYGPENGNAWADPASYIPYMIQYRNFSDTSASTGGGGDKPNFTVTTLANGKLTITWTGSGTLQKAANLTGAAADWSDVTPAVTGNTYTVDASGPRTFFRIRQ